jgi:hypothetical protein
MLYNKFIIAAKSHDKENEIAEIKCAQCECHFELVPNGYACFGGGLYIENEKKKELMMYGKSVDYGEPQFFGWKGLKMLNDKYRDWTIVYVKNIDDIQHAVKVDITKKITF